MGLDAFVMWRITMAGTNVSFVGMGCLIVSWKSSAGVCCGFPSTRVGRGFVSEGLSSLILWLKNNRGKLSGEELKKGCPRGSSNIVHPVDMRGIPDKFVGRAKLSIQRFLRGRSLSL